MFVFIPQILDYFANELYRAYENSARVNNTYVTVIPGTLMRVSMSSTLARAIVIRRWEKSQITRVSCNA